MFRVLIPSWSFFQQVTSVPTLWVRLLDSDSSSAPTTGPWLRCLEPPKTRGWKQFFLNSQGNYTLAAYSLLEQQVTDMEEEAESKVSEELVKNLVQFELGSGRVGPALRPGTRFQYRLLLEEAEIFLSPVYSWEESTR